MHRYAIKSCSLCKYYEFCDHSNWIHTMIFHFCRSPKNAGRERADKINVNKNCKWFEKGKPINYPISRREIKQKKELALCREKAHNLLLYGSVRKPLSIRIRNWFRKIFKK